MLKLFLAEEINLQKIKKGLQEIKDHPSPYDIYQVRKAITFMEKDFKDYLIYLKECCSDNQPEGRVPSTVLFLFNDDVFVGVYNVRHELNEELRKSGGHIAYEIVPSYRQKGYVKEGLKLILKWCSEQLNLQEVLLSCIAENKPSYRAMISVMKEKGGYEDTPIKIDNHLEYRVWIKT